MNTLNDLMAALRSGNGKSLDHPQRAFGWLVDLEYLLSSVDDDSLFVARTVHIDRLVVISGRFVEDVQSDLAGYLEIGESYTDEEEKAVLVRTRLRVTQISPLITINVLGASLRKDGTS